MATIIEGQTDNNTPQYSNLLEIHGHKLLRGYLYPLNRSEIDTPRGMIPITGWFSGPNGSALYDGSMLGKGELGFIQWCLGQRNILQRIIGYHLIKGRRNWSGYSCYGDGTGQLMTDDINGIELETLNPGKITLYLEPQSYHELIKPLIKTWRPPLENFPLDLKEFLPIYYQS